MKIKTTVSPRWARFCGWALRKLGWTSVGGPASERKVVILGVPHTSIWDFLISYLFYTQFGKVAHIMIKQEFFFWPLGPILRSCGAVPIDRKSPGAMIRSLIHAMESVDEFHFAIAPEGTRKAVSKWKTGFHMIARETGSTIYLGYFDWKNKRISIGERFDSTDDVKADMSRIYAYYRELAPEGKHRDGFKIASE
ncbi:MAG: 1-acyl-sn-glycerol-3-phosphate acyltransferase [Bacteroidales bacterium]|nr:1-acyl-sn-glycerol-3-phosphate acyltransferase [Bacteroidales bacterium]